MLICLSCSGIVIRWFMVDWVLIIGSERGVGEDTGDDAGADGLEEEDHVQKTHQCKNSGHSVLSEKVYL